jgi:RNA polymerase sigma-70 factor (ECF subfamily)
MAGPMARMEECVPALRRYASALLRDRQEADDLVHECLVRALDRLHTLRNDAEMRPWLFAILHNLHVSRVRRRQARGQTLSIEAVAGQALAAPPRQEEHLRVQDVVRAVERLPEDHRAVLLLVTVEDLSYAEAARVLGIPVGTVMSRLARARERLRRDTEGEPSAELRRAT